jgi:DNA segregation ATPase FtsK/SpoIIIE-like protein
MFSKIPHLLRPVVTEKEIEKGLSYIIALKKEMEKRLNIFENNEKGLNKLPSIVCIIDEFPAFIRKLTMGKGNKKSYLIITDLLERARKVKIHIVLAAQDTTKGSIGIKITNLTAAIAFKCTNWRDSVAILDAPYAVNLYSKGSLYFKSYQHEGLLRLQGSLMEPEEIENSLESMEFDSDINNEYKIEGLDEPELPLRSGDDEFDSGNISPEDTREESLSKIIFTALGQDNIPNSQIKKIAETGYDNANKFLDELEAFGLVKRPRKGTRLPPTVIPKRIEDIPAGALELLAKHGHTKDDIKNAFNKRLSEAATQDDSGELDSKD